MFLDIEPRWEQFNLPDADVRLLHGLFDPQVSERYLRDLIAEVPWRQDKISMYGKILNLPRLQQWYGDEGLTYTWSGIEMKPLPWTPLLLEIKREVEEHSGVTFNTVLLNRYRNGNDTVTWHSDDEKELGTNPIIASVSFGAERDFQLRHNTRIELGYLNVQLTDGSLLLMAGTTQAYWKHQLPRRKRVLGERVNLTFRRVAVS